MQAAIGGNGLPSGLITGVAARSDPIVISHARSLLAKSPGVITVRGDIRDPVRILPGCILADAELIALTDLAEPACVILSGVLRFADAGTARGVAAAFARAVVPGSYLIISCGSGNRSEGENFATEYTAARIYIHLLAEILGFFDGFALVPPGVVAVRRWYGGGLDLGLAAPTATFPGGVARKP